MLDPSHPSNTPPPYLSDAQGQSAADSMPQPATRVNLAEAFQPQVRPIQSDAASIASARKVGLIFVPLGLLMGWFFIWRPLAEAMRTGTLHYSIKGVLLPPLVLYIGVLGLFTNLRDREIRQLDSRGKPTLTRKGWYVVAGMFVVIAATLAGWFFLLHTLGFHDLT